METLHITRNEIDEQGRYIGEFLVGSWAGNIEIEAGLGYVRFAGRVSAAGCIIAKAGSGIKAGYIEAGLGIKAGGGIEAEWSIEAGFGIEAGLGIKAGGGIEAGLGIKAGGGIEAEWGIEAGGGIEAGLGIKAGYIEAGLGIKAGGGIEAGFRIFAGICTWRIPTDAERAITCARLIAGEVAYGTLVETAAKGSE